MLRRFAAIAFLVAIPLGATPVFITGRGYALNLWGGVSMEGSGVNIHMALDRGPQFVVFCPAGVVCNFDWSGGSVNDVEAWRISGSYDGHAITRSTEAVGYARFDASASFTKQNPAAVVPVSVYGEVWLPEAHLYFTGAGTAHIEPGEYFGPDFGGPRFLFSNFGYLDYHGTLDEVPEPATLLLIAPAAFFVLRKKQRSPGRNQEV